MAEGETELLGGFVATPLAADSPTALNASGSRQSDSIPPID